MLDLSATPAGSTYYLIREHHGHRLGTTNTYAFNRNSTADGHAPQHNISRTAARWHGLPRVHGQHQRRRHRLSATASNNNLLSTPWRGNLTQWWARRWATPDAGRLPGGSGGDASLPSPDPLFISASDLHLPTAGPASPAENAGVTPSTA